MIAKLRHKLLLCRQRDVVITGAEIRLQREGVWSAWAAIEAKKASQFSPNGAAMNENRNTRTHIITMRYRPDLNISALAWLYEEQLKSSPRWFKVLSVSQTEVKGSRFFKFDGRLVERGDDLAQPRAEDDKAKGPVSGLPSGVRL